MDAGREDAVEMALAALRSQLQQGLFGPGARIPASRLAGALRLSPTPVREALSRLVGEGLVEERRRQGFFVRTLSGVDVADLYRLNQGQLLMLPGRDCGFPTPQGEARADDADPVRAVEARFREWVGEVGSVVLIAAHRTVAAQLGPVRRVEARVLGDLTAEAQDLCALTLVDSAAFTAAIRRFHARRIQVADRLAAALNLGRRQ